jgi:hypothetical protein
MTGIRIFSLSCFALSDRRAAGAGQFAVIARKNRRQTARTANKVQAVTALGEMVGMSVTTMGPNRVMRQLRLAGRGVD